MIITILALFTLLVISGFIFVYENSDWSAVVFPLSGILLLLAIPFSLRGSTADKRLSGYIYSSETNWSGYTTAHIRFSQNAGQDVQPSFCVKADSEAGRAIQQYVGTDTKVQIDIPRYFYFANNPFACGTTAMTIKGSGE